MVHGAGKVGGEPLDARPGGELTPQDKATVAQAHTHTIPER
jgi:hypothetical protein